MGEYGKLYNIWYNKWHGENGSAIPIWAVSLYRNKVFLLEMKSNLLKIEERALYCMDYN